jgi:hypothetical protein
MALNPNSLLSSNNFAGTKDDLIDSSVGGALAFSNYGRYLSGSKAIIKINGNLFGFAFSVNFNITTEQQEVWTIDDYTPYEFAPGKIIVNGTLGMFHVPSKGPTKQLLQGNLLGHLFHRYVTIRIEDQMSGQKIFETKKAIITSRSQAIRAGELSAIELEWKAIGWSDEAGIFYPKGYNTSKVEGPIITGTTEGVDAPPRDPSDFPIA